VSDSYTHNLEKLLSLSGLKVEYLKEIQSNPEFANNWAVTKDWSEEARYSTVISEAEARDLYSAVTARKNGVLTWLKKWW